MQDSPKIFDNVLSEIDSGIKGLNSGLSMGFNRLVDVVPNIQRRNMYLVGGATGSGKSAFAMNSFVYSPYDDWKQNHSTTSKLKIFVWSMEVDKTVLLTKGVCRKIWDKHKVLVDVNYILSRGKNRISQELYDMVLSVRDYFNEFEEHVEILRSDNPTGIRNFLIKYMESIGKSTNKSIKINHKDGTTENIEIRDKYVSDNEHTYTICLFDHMANLKTERDFNKKQKIDKLVEYLIDLRDWYGISPVMVQQLNRDMTNVERFKQGRVDPTLDDFKESKQKKIILHT